MIEFNTKVGISYNANEIPLVRQGEFKSLNLGLSFCAS